MKTYQIHLIRCGVTDANLDGRYIGRTDVPLSAESIRDLRHLQERGGYPTAEVYYTSPRLRCIQTMNLLYPGQDCYEVPGFDEIDFGEWEGKTAEELQDDENFQQWLNRSTNITPPGGESVADMYERVCRTLGMIADGMMRSGCHSAVIVTHGGVISYLLSAYGLPEASFYDWMTAPGHGYSLRLMPSLWMSGRKAEVYQMLPTVPDEDSAAQQAVALGREAAQRSIGLSKPDEDEIDRDNWQPYEHDDDEDDA